MYSCLYAQKGTQIFRQYIDLTKSNFTNQNQFLLKIMQAKKTIKHYVVVLNLIIVENYVLSFLTSSDNTCTYDLLS